MKVSSVIILGSTGSIGLSALRVIDNFNDEFSILGLSCNSNLSIFAEQLKRYHPEYAAIADENILNSDQYLELKKFNPRIKFLEGAAGLLELVSHQADILLSAIVGAAGLLPTLKALPNIKRLALANKETMVMAGDIVINEIKKYNVELIPVDSEHSAIFSLLQNNNIDNLEKIIITASGGSLRDRSLTELENVTIDEALAHPVWNMGNKITIDSSTLINKGLEVIEAHYIFNQPYDKIEVIIHPESIIHSLIETVDGSVYAHLGKPDMALPILNAFTFPGKRKNPFGRLNFSEIESLSFRVYDEERFPALKLCYAAGKSGGTMPAVLNAANEVAVQAFLDKKITYMDIVRVIKETLDSHVRISLPDINDIFKADDWARENTKINILKRGNKCK